MSKAELNVSLNAGDAFRSRLAAALARPVLLEPGSVDVVRTAGAFSPRAETGAAAQPFARVAGGVAVVDICGPLAQRAWSCWMFSGDGYDAITSRMRTALDDAGVLAVVMRIDSPGGEVAGCFEAVHAIRDAARLAGKPIVAFADEMACSAAYALACAADEIVLPPTGVVGSVGVIATLVEKSRALDAMGVTINVLTSGARKADGHSALPMSDESRAALQREIDYLADVFATEVADSRGMIPANIRALDAAVFYGPKAIEAGLADEIGSFEHALEVAAVRGKRKRMEPINKALGLKADATQAEAVAEIDAKTAFELEQCAALGVSDRAEAKGAVAALKARAEQADAALAEVAALKAAMEARDRVDLIEQGKREGKLSPNMVSKLVPELDTKALRTFLQHAPRVVPADTGLAPPPPKSAAERVGKTWEALKPAERAALYQEDRAAYDALKAAAEGSR